MWDVYFSVYIKKNVLQKRCFFYCLFNEEGRAVDLHLFYADPDPAVFSGPGPGPA